MRRRPRSERLPARERSGADLHVHTTHSDGVCAPGEVVRAADTVGLAALAITDHDTLSALAPARIEAERLGIELIAGVELTCQHLDREVHLLAYFVRPEDPALLAAIDQLRARREGRIVAMAERLAGLGLSVDLAALRRDWPRAALGRPHLADWLVRTGQVGSVREAFVRFLHDGGPVHVVRPALPIAEALALTQNASGVAALAHPPYDSTLVQFQELAAWGLRGRGGRSRNPRHAGPPLACLGRGAGTGPRGRFRLPRP